MRTHTFVIGEEVRIKDLPHINRYYRGKIGIVKKCLENDRYFVAIDKVQYLFYGSELEADND